MQKQKPSDKDKLLAALSYLWILAVIPFTIGQHKPFVRRHAKQGLALFIAESVIMAVGWFPLLGWVVLFFGWMFAVVVSLIGIAHALAGRAYSIPFLNRYIKD